MNAATKSVVVEREMPHPPEKLWRALTQPHLIAEWLMKNDFVPNELLGSYWYCLNERYDHIVNLCESVEGLLLALPGRLNHQYSDETRRRLCGKVNYMERTCDIAAVPHDFSGSRF